MKTLALLSILAAAPLSTGLHQLTINGKMIGQVVVIQGGIWAVSVEDFARAAGAGLTLEPAFSLQGNRLVANPPATAAKEYKPQKADGSLDAGIHFKYDLKAQKEARMAPGQVLGVQHPGVISSNIMMMNGKAYVPVPDLIRAFGDGSVHGAFTGNLAPGQNVNLNLHPNSNSIIAVLIGM
jgi:hypothetical protein